MKSGIFSSRTRACCRRLVVPFSEMWMVWIVRAFLTIGVVWSSWAVNFEAAFRGRRGAELEPAVRISAACDEGNGRRTTLGKRLRKR